jgi:hypothetical protein
VKEFDGSQIGLRFLQHLACALFRFGVADQNAHTLHAGQLADDFRVDPRNGRELSGPVAAIVRPGNPGGFVRLPLGGHPKAEGAGRRVHQSSILEVMGA